MRWLERFQSANRSRVGSADWTGKAWLAAALSTGLKVDANDAHLSPTPFTLQAGFVKAESLQTLLPNYQDSYQETTMTPGYGEGLFVVIKAQRPDIADRPG